VIPVDSPIWGKSSEVYRRALDRSLKNGKLPPTGISGGLEYDAIGVLTPVAQDAVAIFIDTIVSSPSAYLKGVYRTLEVYVSVVPEESENLGYEKRLTSDDGALPRILPGPARFPPLEGRFILPTADSLVARSIRAFDPLYRLLIPWSSLMLIALAVHAGLRRDSMLLMMASVPLAYLLLHAAILNSQDRMAIPAYPIVLCAIPLACHRFLPGALLPRVWPRNTLSLAAGVTVLILVAGSAGSPATTVSVSSGVAPAARLSSTQLALIAKLEGQLVRAQSHSVPSEAGKVYVVREGMKRWVLSIAWMKQHGFNYLTDIRDITEEESNAIPTDTRPPLE
jgi:hypothetical protein